VIIDANVAIKWLVDEEHASVARTYQTRTDLIAPDLMDIEVANALGRIRRRRSISHVDALRLWEGFVQAPIIRIPWRELARDAFRLSLELHASFYDCSYLALALAMNDMFVTADRKFVNAVSSRPALAAHVRALV
jgi:predicted nucleic acid-binding protein